MIHLYQTIFIKNNIHLNNSIHNLNDTLTCVNCGFVYNIGSPLCPKCGT